MLLTNFGPNTSPGKSFINSHPNSSAVAISFKYPQPADQSNYCRLHKLAISSLNTGVTIKFAPANMK